MRRYGPKYSELRPKVAEILLKEVLNKDSSSLGQYGGLKGLGNLGAVVAREALLGNLIEIATLIRFRKNNRAYILEDPIENMATQRC